jgi:hypothetical protein
LHKEGGDKVGLKQYACDYSLPYYAMEDDYKKKDEFESIIEENLKVNAK